MKVLKKWPFSLICVFVIFGGSIFALDRGICVSGGQLSIHFSSPRMTLVRYSKQKKETGFTSKNGNLEKVSINERQYSLKQLKKRMRPKKYKRLINLVNQYNIVYRLIVAYLTIVFAFLIVCLFPEKNNGDMIITNTICSILSIIVTVVNFIDPSLKSDYLLSIVVIFYSTAQLLIKLMT